MTSMGTAVRTGLDTYDLSGLLPDDRLAAVPAGSNILVSGPPMLGKERLALRALTLVQRRTEASVIVTTDQNADQLLTTYEDLDAAVATDDVYVVDCSGTATGGTVGETANVKHVATPEDLTGIGMGIAKCTRTIGEEAENGLGFGLISLSTLLQYTSTERVFNFTHVMTGRVSAAGYLGLWTIDSATHDDQTLTTLQAHFDYVVELREGESGDRDVRVLGGDDAWRTWEPLERA